MTSTYVYDRTDELLAWAETKIPNCRFRTDAVAIGHLRDDRIAGVVVFDTFSANSCCISLASDGSARWMTRAFAVRAMAYPFIQCGFNHVLSVVSSLNEASLRYTERFGWTRTGVLREAGALKEDLIVFDLLRRECRFLPENNPALFPARATAGKKALVAV